MTPAQAPRFAPTAAEGRVLRPWGWFETLRLGAGFQVKLLAVVPGGRLSLQKHAHRAEHWVVVRGVAEVDLDGRRLVLHSTQSVDIPLGAVHRLANSGDQPLEVIEVQSGAYLGEDDIVRLEDAYGRV